MISIKSVKIESTISKNTKKLILLMSLALLLTYGGALIGLNLGREYLLGVSLVSLLLVICFCMARACDNNKLTLVIFPFLCFSTGLLACTGIPVKFAQVIPDALLLTVIVGCVSGLAGLLIKKDLTFLGNILYSALIVLILLTVINIFIPIIPVAPISYVGAGLFSLYILYDIWKYKRTAQNTLLSWGDTAMVAVELLLDFTNLFLFIVRIIADND